MATRESDQLWVVELRVGAGEWEATLRVDVTREGAKILKERWELYGVLGRDERLRVVKYGRVRP